MVVLGFLACSAPKDTVGPVKALVERSLFLASVHVDPEGRMNVGPVAIATSVVEFFSKAQGSLLRWSNGYNGTHYSRE